MGSSFLPKGEAEDFATSYRSSPRHIRSMDSTERRESQSLADVVLGEVDQLWYGWQGVGRHFAALVVQVDEFDGMSWAASAVESLVGGSTRPRFHVRCLQGELRPGAAPAVLDLLPKKTVQRLAREHELVKTRATHVRVSRWVIGIALALLLLAAWVYNAGRGSGRGETIDGAVLALVGIAVIATPALVSYWANNVKLRGAQITDDELASWLDANVETRAYRDLIGAFVEELSVVDEPRCVVVDAFDRLDAHTRSVIEAVFRRPDRQGVDLWVVFETQGCSGLYTQGYLRHTRAAFRGVSFFTMDYLSETQRRRLATLEDNPDAFDLYRVGVIRPKSDHAPHATFEEAFFAQHRGSPALSLFYLLAIGSAWSGRIMHRRSVLSELLAPKSNRQRTTVLHAAMATEGMKQPSLSSTTVESLIDEVIRDFARYLNVEQVGGDTFISVYPPTIGRTMAEQASDLGLPPPSVAHLFWALAWNDRFRNAPASGAWLRKVASHLSHVKRTELARAGLKPGIAVPHFECAVDTATRSIELCMRDLISSTFELGVAIVAHHSSGEWRGRKVRLARLGWRAYALTAEERLLSHLMLLEAELRTVRAGPAVLPPLQKVFAAGLGPDGSAVAIDSVLATVASDRGKASVVRYGESISSWIALTLPYVYKAEVRPMVSPLLDAAGTAARAGLVGIVRDAHAGFTRGSGDEEWYVIDGITLAAATWSLALVVKGSATKGDEVDLVAVADVLRTILADPAPDADGEPQPLVVELLAADVVAAASAAALVVGGLIEDGAALVDLADRVMRERGLRAPEGAETARSSAGILNQLDLISLVWRRLGFPHLACLVAVRRVQLVSLVTAATGRADLIATAIDQLDLSQDRPTLETLLAAMATTMASDENGELGATALVGAWGATRDAMASALSMEVAWVALVRSSSFNVKETEEVLRALLAYRGPDGHSGVGAPLVALADDQLDYVIPALTNGLFEGDDKSLVTAIHDELRKRVEVIEDLEVREDLLQVLDASELRLAPVDASVVDAVLERWEGRPRTATWPFVLNCLLIVGTPSERLLTAMTDAIETADPATKGVLNTTNLAVRLVLTRVPDGEVGDRAEQAAIRWLERELLRDVPRMPLDRVVDALRFMSRKTGEPRFRAALDEYEPLRLQLDEVRMLQLSLRTGRYFTIFLHYLRVLGYWGLSTDAGSLWSLVDRSRNGDAPQGGDTVPVVEIGSERVVSGAFIVRGLRAQQEGGVELADVERAAGAALDELFDCILSLSELPPRLRGVLERHRDQVVASRLVV